MYAGTRRFLLLFTSQVAPRPRICTQKSPTVDRYTFVMNFLRILNRLGYFGHTIKDLLIPRVFSFNLNVQEVYVLRERVS